MKTALSVVTILTLVLGLGLAGQARAHCEIPCGIYGDPLRFKQLAEDITTVEKSMKEIQAISAKKDKTAQDYNQLARWVDNKEVHASKIQDVVSQYFLHQRIKPAPKAKKKAYQKYISQLTAAHALLIGAMHAKQTVDLKVIEQLRADLATFEQAYTGK